MTSSRSDIRVVGIDPSLTGTGIASPDGCETISVKAPGKDAEPLADLRRLQQIVVQVAGHCVGADLAVIETPAFSRITGKATERAGLHWMIRHQLAEMGVPVAVVTSSCRCKYATGKGNADKDSVLIAVVQRMPIMVANNNEADAAVLYAMGMDHLGQPIACMPALHRASLSAVKWPA